MCAQQMTTPDEIVQKTREGAAEGAEMGAAFGPFGAGFGAGWGAAFGYLDAASEEMADPENMSMMMGLGSSDD